jgi:hypothetical protein
MAAPLQRKERETDQPPEDQFKPLAVRVAAAIVGTMRANNEPTAAMALTPGRALGPPFGQFSGKG